MISSASSSFLAPLHEDPRSSRMQGWLADEAEYLALKDKPTSSSIILILGEPSAEDLELIRATAPSTSLLLMPPLLQLSAHTSSPASSSSAQAPAAEVIALATSVAINGLARVLEEATGHALRWRKARSKAMARKASSSAAGSSTPNRLSTLMGRRLSVLSLSTAGDDGAPGFEPETPVPGRPPFDVVLHFLPALDSPNPTSSSASPTLQSLLSASFLVTTVVLPLLSAKAPARPQSTPLSASSKRVTSSLSQSTLAPSSYVAAPTDSPRASPTGSPTSRTISLPRSASRPSSIFSFTDSAASLSSNSILIHVLPHDAPAMLPVLLDRFMSPFLDSYSRVTMAAMPASILSLRPSSSGELEGSEENEEEEEEEESVSTRDQDLPQIVSLLLAAALRPPLLPPNLSSQSRRLSSSSQSSISSQGSVSRPSPRASSSNLAGSAPRPNRTYIPSPSCITLLTSSSFSQGRGASPPSPTSHTPPSSHPVSRSGSLANIRLASPVIIPASPTLTSASAPSPPRAASSSPPRFQAMLPSDSAASSEQSDGPATPPGSAYGDQPFKSAAGSGGGGSWLGRVFGRLGKRSSARSLR